MDGLSGDFPGQLLQNGHMGGFTNEFFFTDTLAEKKNLFGCFAGEHLPDRELVSQPLFIIMQDVFLQLPRVSLL